MNLDATTYTNSHPPVSFFIGATRIDLTPFRVRKNCS